MAVSLPPALAARLQQRGIALDAERRQKAMAMRFGG